MLCGPTKAFARSNWPRSLETVQFVYYFEIFIEPIARIKWGKSRIVWTKSTFRTIFRWIQIFAELMMERNICEKVNMRQMNDWMWRRNWDANTQLVMCSQIEFTQKRRNKNRFICIKFLCILGILAWICAGERRSSIFCSGIQLIYDEWVGSFVTSKTFSRRKDSESREEMQRKENARRQTKDLASVVNLANVCKVQR